MKKSLIVIALLEATTGTVSAQTSVTPYGIIDIGIARENNGGPAGSVNRLDSGNLNGSRLGFKGSEDLGGGLTAVFQLENGFSADTGALGQGGLLFGRHAWVGINGGFGSVKLGRQITGVYANADTFDPFQNALAGDSARLFNYSGNRTNNVVSYGLERNGFRGQLQYGLGEVPGSSSAGRTLGAWGGYKTGSFDVVATYHDTNNVANTASATTTLIGGNIDLHVIRLYAAYARNKGVQGIGVDTRDALIGFRAPVGQAGTVIASYIRKSNKSIGDADASQLAIGYTQDLSKRTALYTSFSRTENDGAAGYNAGAPGTTGRLFNLGIRHRF